MTYRLGIDIGIDHTVWATVSRQNDGSQSIDGATVDSVVAIHQGRLVAGADLDEVDPAALEHVTTGFVSRLGEVTPIIVGSTPYGAESLIAGVLTSVVAQARKRHGGEPAAVVLVHDDGLDEYRTGLLTEAARVAGVPLASLVLVARSEAADAASTAKSIKFPTMLGLAVGASLVGWARVPDAVIAAAGGGGDASAAAGGVAIGGLGAAFGASALTGGQGTAAVVGPAGTPLTVAGPAGTPLTTAGPAGTPLTTAGPAGTPLTTAGPAGTPLTTAGPAGTPLTGAGPAGTPLTTAGPAGTPLTTAGPAGTPLTSGAGPAGTPLTPGPGAGPADTPSAPDAGPADTPSGPDAGPADTPSGPDAGPADTPSGPGAGPADTPPESLVIISDTPERHPVDVRKWIVVGAAAAIAVLVVVANASDTTSSREAVADVADADTAISVLETTSTIGDGGVSTSTVGDSSVSTSTASTIAGGAGLVTTPPTSPATTPPTAPPTTPAPDTTKPVASSPGRSPSAIHDSSDAPDCAITSTLTVTATDNVAVTQVTGTYSGLGGSPKAFSKGGGNTWSATFGPFGGIAFLSSTNITISIVARDAAGNASTAVQTSVLVYGPGQCLI